MDILNRVSDTITSASRDIARKTRETAEVARLNSAISGCQDRMKRTYLQIGEMYYMETKGSPYPDYEQLFQVIEECHRQIKGYRETISKVRENNEGTVKEFTEVCPQCGKTVETGAAYCSRCGAKMNESSTETMESEEIIEEAQEVEAEREQRQ